METNIIRSIVRGAYDIQKLRIMTGNRVTGNFKAKLGQSAGTKEVDLEKEQQDIIKKLRASYTKITDGVIASTKTGKVTERKFKGDEVISTFTEYCLVEQYMELLAQEKKHFDRLGRVLNDIPIYKEFLSGVKGCGPAMSGVVISEINIHRAEYPSSLHMYAGLDVAQDGKGRSRRKEHLQKIEYVTKDGETDTKSGITFNPFLKTKLTGVLASSFLRAGENPYSKIYYDYKHRLENMPAHQDKSKAHRNNMALRYMIKRFLVDLYVKWRTLEGLPVADEYAVAKLGIIHKKAS